MYKVKVFDEEHEKDLESSINDYLEGLKDELVDIKYQVAMSTFGEEQLYVFSAMVITKK